MLLACRKIVAAGVQGEIGDQVCGPAQRSWRRTYNRFIIPTPLNNAKCNEVPAHEKARAVLLHGKWLSFPG